jgi:hypothetical protein
MRKEIIGLVLISMAMFLFAGCGGGSGSALPVTSTAQATTIPLSPTGVAVIGGATQATISWYPSPGATSYNIYWSPSIAGTSPVFTKISNAVSPYVQTGLTAGVNYIYFVTAENSAGESVPSSQVYALTNSLPSAPTMVIATGGVGQETITWNPVPGATSYNLYWSNAAGILIGLGGENEDPNRIEILNVTSPYVWTGTGIPNPFSSIIPPITVTSNTPYYFVVTAVNSAGEVASAEVSGTTL